MTAILYGNVRIERTAHGLMLEHPDTRHTETSRQLTLPRSLVSSSSS
jgi:hypothetical protein